MLLYFAILLPIFFPLTLVLFLIVKFIEFLEKRCSHKIQGLN